MTSERGSGDTTHGPALSSVIDQEKENVPDSAIHRSATVTERRSVGESGDKSIRSGVAIVLNQAGEVTGTITRVEATKTKGEVPSSALNNYKTRKRSVWHRCTDVAVMGARGLMGEGTGRGC